MITKKEYEILMRAANALDVLADQTDIRAKRVVILRRAREVREIANRYKPEPANIIECEDGRLRCECGMMLQEGHDGYPDVCPACGTELNWVGFYTGPEVDGLAID